MTLTNYRLKYYIKKLEEFIILGDTNLYGKQDIFISGVTYNSKEVKQNNLFVCKGANFKKEYLEEALEKGALAYISDKKYELEGNVPHIIVEDIRKVMAPLASIFYNNPQEKLTLIAVGGTKGKTTTSYYYKAALDQYLVAQNKNKAGIISSIITYDGIEEKESSNTTPEAIELIKYLYNAVKSGLEYFVLEVSSQALKYHRTDMLNFDLAVFLNIDEDHISPIEHPSYNDYLESKLKMFPQSQNVVVYNETSEKEKILNRVKKYSKTYRTYSMKDKEADYYISDVSSSGIESHFKVSFSDQKKEYKISMPGTFNIENATAVIAGLDILGIPQSYIQEVLPKIHVPGRTEFYPTKDKQVIGVVDFAHNRLSMEKIYDLIRRNYSGYKIVSVFGSAGDKAYVRRKELGEAAGKNSDYVYLTMEDPGYESVYQISEDIAKYLKEYNTSYRIIKKREEAIETAFKEVEGPTVILVAGKGHENTNSIKGKNVPYLTDIYYVQKFVEQYNKEMK